MTVDVNLIKTLREKTGAGIADCREVLEESKGDIKKAEELLKARGLQPMQDLLIHTFITVA